MAETRQQSRSSESAESAPRMDRRNVLGQLAAFAAGLAMGRPRVAGAAQAPPPRTNMENPFVGEIALVGFNFAPVGWALCNGQLLAINQNTALFSLLGTMYGGDGVTTFALPDLRGRVPLHMGQGPGLSNRTIGEAAGAESSTLTPAQMPAHTHQAMSTSFNGVTDSPVGNVPARDAAGTPIYGTVPNAPMHAGAIQSTGGSQPHDNMQPFLAINYIISLVGIYPSRS